MKTQIARKRTPMTVDMARELVELAVRIRLMCAADRLQPRNRSLTVQGPWGEPVEVEFIDRQPDRFLGFQVSAGTAVVARLTRRCRLNNLPACFPATTRPVGTAACAGKGNTLATEPSPRLASNSVQFSLLY